MPSEKPAPTALVSADPIRNFSLTVEERIRAITIGPPPWAVRKRTIEDEEKRLVGQLVALHDRLTTAGRAEREVALAVQAAATAFNYVSMNELVAKHNRFYPIEANLPMDRTGDYLVYGRPWKREQPYTPARMLALAKAMLVARASS